MRNIIIRQFAFVLILCFVISHSGFSQVYTFKKDTIRYHDLVSPVYLSQSNNIPSFWDDAYWVIPIGFDFLGHDTLTVSSNGLVSLVNYDNLTDQQVAYTISAFADISIGADLINRDIANPQNSPVNYLLDISSSKKILKIEWKNAGFVYDNSATKQDFISFQLWLYEDSNNIEMRYGQHHFNSTMPYVGNNSFGPVIGIGSYKYDLSTASSHYNEYVNSAPSIYLTGNAIAPGTSASFSTLTAGDTGTCAPVRNARFKFTRDLSVTGIRKGRKLDADVFPNPVSGPLHIEFENKAGAVISLYDVCGKLVYQETDPISNGLFSGILETDKFPKGLYLLRIESGTAAYSELLNIQ